jgi:hypothetical protein
LIINIVCEHCGHSDGNASMMCGGISTHRHSFPANDCVTISRDCAKRLLRMSINQHTAENVAELKQALQTEES